MAGTDTLNGSGEMGLYSVNVHAMKTELEELPE